VRAHAFRRLASFLPLRIPGGLVTEPVAAGGGAGGAAPDGDGAAAQGRAGGRGGARHPRRPGLRLPLRRRERLRLRGRGRHGRLRPRCRREGQERWECGGGRAVGVGAGSPGGVAAVGFA